jgi:hypothetical protein
LQVLSFKPPLPDPLKTPPFFSQWAKLENFFANPSGRERPPERPLARVDQAMTVKLEKVSAV